MATITPVTPASDGTAVVYTAASAGGDVIATGHAPTKLLVRNASAASIVVTLAGAVDCSQGFLHPQTITCPVGDTEAIVDGHTVAANGNVAATYSASASITVAAVTL